MVGFGIEVPVETLVEMLVEMPADMPAEELEQKFALAGPVDTLADESMEWLVTLARPGERLANELMESGERPAELMKPGEKLAEDSVELGQMLATELLEIEETTADESELVEKLRGLVRPGETLLGGELTESGERLAGTLSPKERLAEEWAGPGDRPAAVLLQSGEGPAKLAKPEARPAERGGRRQADEWVGPGERLAAELIESGGELAVLMKPEERPAGELLESEPKPVERLEELVGPGGRLASELVVEPEERPAGERPGSGERLAQLLIGMPMKPPKEGSVLNDRAQFCGCGFVESNFCCCSCCSR